MRKARQEELCRPSPNIVTIQSKIIFLFTVGADVGAFDLVFLIDVQADQGGGVNLLPAQSALELDSDR
jgi:hypothetical protein